MTKEKKLINRLIKVSIISIVILAGVFALYYLISSQNEDLADEIFKTKQNYGEADKQNKTMQARLADSKKARESYENFSQTRDGDVQNFRRDFARTLFARLRDQDSIIDLSFNMEPFTKASKIYDKPAVSLYKSKITVNFTGDTDIDVYNLIRDICESFPGNVEIISYEIDRQQHEVDDNILMAIGSGQPRDALVKGQIIFEWQGIQNNPDYKKSTTPLIVPGGAANPNPPPGGPVNPVPSPEMNPANPQPVAAPNV